MSAIVAWLDRLGLSKYTSVFVDNEVDLDVLPRLSEDDLRELGLPLGARKKILNAVVALRERGSSTAAAPAADKPDAASPREAERRQITVLFSDVVGSMELAERVDVEDLRSLVLAYQRACAKAIDRRGGHVAQYLGDGVLAYFGYPHAHEDDAVRGVDAALKIIDGMREMNGRLLEEHGHGLAVRVGLHTGLVVVGEMGAGATRENLAIGETPNVAARIQGLAEPGTVAVSDATWRLVDGFFTAEPLGTQSLKGVSRPTPVHRIIARTEIVNRFDARIARSLTQLVSRELELGFLQKRWEQSKEGEGQMVLVQGDAGIGKSRLVRAFREQLAQSDYHAITLNCSSQHQASAFYPVVQHLSRALNFVPEEAHSARQEKLAEFLTRLELPSDRFLPALAALLGVATDERTPRPSSEPDQVRRIAFEALVRIVTALSRERPVLFVVDDVHWIDPTTQDLLGHTLDAIQDQQVLMLLTARLEFKPPWVGRAHFSTLSVSRLSRRETEAMIRRVADTELSPEVLSQLVARTDGVPLFVEELTKSMLEASADSSARPAAVPATLQDALTARLDRLAPVRDLVQVAALLGRVFDVELVRAVTGLESGELDRSLAELADAGLIYGRSQQHSQSFEFKHALIQEAALNTLVRQRRAVLNGRIAEAIERLRPEMVQLQPEVLAHHFDEAGNAESAWPFWRAAGELAAQRSASPEAVKHFTHATECFKRLGSGSLSAEDETTTYLGLSTALMQAEGYRSETLAAAAAAARRTARVADDKALQWRVEFDTAPIFYATGRNREFLAAVEMDDISLSQLDVGLRAGVFVTRGVAHHNRGECLRADECFGTASGLLSQPHVSPWPRLGGGEISIVYYAYAGRTAQRLGRLEEALRIGIAAEKIGRSLDDEFSLAWAVLARSRAHFMLGDDEAALRDSEEVIAICRQRGYSARLGNGLHYRGLIRARSGELEAGIDDCQKALAIWRVAGVVFTTPELAVGLADVLLMAGRTAEAVSVLDDVDILVHGTDEAAELAECQRVRGTIAMALGDMAAAERWLETAIATARRQAARLYELRATTKLAEQMVTQGRQDEAARRLRHIYE